MGRYVVGPTLTELTPQGVLAWVARELQRVSDAFFQTVENPIVELHAEPAKKRTGMIVLADGTNWNPGAGRGMYWYDATTTTWKFLG